MVAHAGHCLLNSVIAHFFGGLWCLILYLGGWCFSGICLYLRYSGLWCLTSCYSGCLWLPRCLVRWSLRWLPWWSPRWPLRWSPRWSPTCRPPAPLTKRRSRLWVSYSPRRFVVHLQWIGLVFLDVETRSMLWNVQIEKCWNVQGLKEKTFHSAWLCSQRHGQFRSKQDFRAIEDDTFVAVMVAMTVVMVVMIVMVVGTVM